MQRSEGGGLGMGGGGRPEGLMSARGAARFPYEGDDGAGEGLFVVLGIILAAIGIGATESRSIDSTLDRSDRYGAGRRASRRTCWATSRRRLRRGRRLGCSANGAPAGAIRETRSRGAAQ